MKVSVCMITYNHQRFIAQAIDSVLMQQVGFDYEIVIGEDCSTDNTRSIVIDYENRFPDRIKSLLNEKNLGMMLNFIQTMQACTGQYIALCEGDDYWTLPQKLQKQVDFLDSHPEFAICSHNVKVKREGSTQSHEWLGARHKEVSTLEDLLRDGSGGATSSLVFRNRVFGDFPEWYYTIHGGDWALQVLCASHGKLRYFREVMGCYRIHAGGSLAHFSAKAEAVEIEAIALPSKYSIDVCECVNKHFNYRYNSLIKKRIAYWHWYAALDYKAHGKIKIARKYALKVLSELLPPSNWFTAKDLQILFLLFLPSSIVSAIKVVLRSSLRLIRRIKQFIANRWVRRIFNNLYVKYKNFSVIPKDTFIENLYLCKRFSAVDGCVVECGVWKGGMVAAIAEIMSSHRQYYLFDSFDGLPPAQEIDGEAAKAWQKDTSSPWYFDNCRVEIEFAEKAMQLSGAKRYQLIKGWFSETLANFSPNQQIAVLRLDSDWYNSTMQCLNGLYKYVVKGGLIIIDDYYTWDGCAKAVHEFLSINQLPDKIYQSSKGVCYIVKQS